MSDWCKSHPRYSAKKMPNSLCGKCFQLYFLKNPEVKPRLEETYADLEKVRAHLMRP